MELLILVIVIVWLCLRKEETVKCSYCDVGSSQKEKNNELDWPNSYILTLTCLMLISGFIFSGYQVALYTSYMFDPSNLLTYLQIVILSLFLFITQLSLVILVLILIALFVNKKSAGEKSFKPDFFGFAKIWIKICACVVIMYLVDSMIPFPFFPKSINFYQFITASSNWMFFYSIFVFCAIVLCDFS